MYGKSSTNCLFASSTTAFVDDAAFGYVNAFKDHVNAASSLVHC